MIVSASRKFVFVHVPKCAGTSMMIALEPFADGQWAADGNSAHETLPQFMTRHPEMKDHFKFAFVRNPWERAVSFYFHARQRLAPTIPQMQAVDSVAAMLRLLDKGVEWIRNLISLRPQSDFIHGADGFPMTDFVGRYERLDEDFGAACRRAGIETALPKKNASNHGHYAQYYDGWAKSFVAAHYAQDIQEFGYSFEALS